MTFYGCIGVQGAWGHTKTMHAGLKMVVQSIFSALWPGKFPRTSCCAMTGEKWRGWVLAGINGFVWVGRGAGARAERKTREKEGLILEKDMFCKGGRENKNSIQLAGVVRW